MVRSPEMSTGEKNKDVMERAPLQPYLKLISIHLRPLPKATVDLIEHLPKGQRKVGNLARRLKEHICTWSFLMHQGFPVPLIGMFTLLPLWLLLRVDADGQKATHNYSYPLARSTATGRRKSLLHGTTLRQSKSPKSPATSSGTVIQDLLYTWTRVIRTLMSFSISPKAKVVTGLDEPKQNLGLFHDVLWRCD